MNASSLLWLMLACQTPDEKAVDETADTGPPAWETPCPSLTGLRRVGTGWTYAGSSGPGDYAVDMEVVGAEGASVSVTEDWTYTVSGGEPQTWQIVQDYRCDDAGLSQAGWTNADVQVLYDPPRLLVPAEVVEQMSWKINSRASNLHSGSVTSTTTELWTCGAGAWEERTVPAGTFDALRLSCASEGDFLTIGWFSAEVGMIDDNTIQLLSYAL